MTDAQAERLIQELRGIRLALWASLLIAVGIFTAFEIIQVVIGPPPVPTTSISPPAPRP
jgi:hypothetical protein